MQPVAGLKNVRLANIKNVRCTVDWLNKNMVLLCGLQNTSKRLKIEFEVYSETGQDESKLKQNECTMFIFQFVFPL